MQTDTKPSSTEPTPTDAAPAEAAPKAGVLQLINTLFWALLGIRSGKGYRTDISRITPLQIVIAGLVGGLVLVLTLIFIARAVVGDAAM